MNRTTIIVAKQLGTNLWTIVRSFWAQNAVSSKDSSEQAWVWESKGGLIFSEWLRLWTIYIRKGIIWAKHNPKARLGGTPSERRPLRERNARQDLQFATTC